MRNYYSILGIPSGATQDEIKEAWNFSVKAFHPDKFAGSSRRQQTVAQERTTAVNEAYEILSDATLRANYDREYARKTRAESTPPPPPRSAPPPPPPPPPRSSTSRAYTSAKGNGAQATAPPKSSSHREQIRNEPLSFWESVFTALYGAVLGLLGLLFVWPQASRFKSDGYILKSEKSWRLYWFAFGVRLAVVVIWITIAASGLWRPQSVTRPETPRSPTAFVQSSFQTLPNDCVELQPHQAVIPGHPYERPKFDDPLYDPLKEADVKADKAVRLYERGVFVGYGEISAAKPVSTQTPTATTSVPEMSHTAETQFVRYTNPNYKFSAVVPSNVFVKNEMPSSNDGALFVSEDGRTKALFIGKHNPRGRTLAKIYSDWAAEHTATDPGKVVDYKVLRDGWFVVSGRDGARGFYVKGVLRQETLLLMCLEYDEQDCPLTDQDISVMARLFDGK